MCVFADGAELWQGEDFKPAVTAREAASSLQIEDQGALPDDRANRNHVVQRAAQHYRGKEEYLIYIYIYGFSWGFFPSLKAELRPNIL